MIYIKTSGKNGSGNVENDDIFNGI